jgi:hypothetical protein
MALLDAVAVQYAAVQRTASEVKVAAILVNNGGTRCKGRTTPPTKADSDVFKTVFIQFPAIGQIRCVNEMEAKAFSKEGHSVRLHGNAAGLSRSQA